MSKPNIKVRFNRDRSNKVFGGEIINQILILNDRFSLSRWL